MIRQVCVVYTSLIDLLRAGSDDIGKLEPSHHIAAHTLVIGDNVLYIDWLHGFFCSCSSSAFLNVAAFVALLSHVVVCIIGVNILNITCFGSIF